MKTVLGIGVALFCVFFLSLPSGAQELPAPVPFSLSEAAPSFGPVGPFLDASASLVVDGGMGVAYVEIFAGGTLAETCAAVTRTVVVAIDYLTTGCPGDSVEGENVPFGFACSSPCTVTLSGTVPFAFGAIRTPTEYGGVDFYGQIQSLTADSPTTTTTTVAPTTTTVPPVQSVQLEGIGVDGLAWVARFLLFALGMVIGR